MNHLSRALGAMFTPPAARKPDTQRKARETAKALAAAHRLTIEKSRDGSFDVYPPRDWAGPDLGHYCSDWAEVLEACEAYAAAAKEAARPGFEELMRSVASHLASGRLTTADTFSIADAIGLPSLVVLADRPGLLPAARAAVAERAKAAP